MPQAIEWSLATPMINPRLPCISPDICTTTLDTSSGRRPDLSTGRQPRPFQSQSSRVEPFENDGRVGAAEPERVRQHAGKRLIVPSLAHDRHVREIRIEILDI